jgi:anti-sigma B factor antagonist/stage II sporulation protein AA (anti-sigma F factor antagonist)
MHITKTQTGEKITFTLSGRADTVSSPEFQEKLIPAFGEAKEITVDFTELAYISSAGLRVLLMGQKTAKAKGASMTITGVSEEIMKVLEMTGLLGVLTVV